MMGMMLTGRSVQGAAAGGIVILVNICISDLFTERERGFYLGLTGVVWGLASGIGPLAGGAFSEYVSWRWNWWINLPCCGVSFVVLFFCLDRVRERQAGISSGLRQVDWLGTLAITGLTTMSLLGLNFGVICLLLICLLVFGGFTMAAFVVYEAKIISEEKALIPMRILRRLSNNASLFVNVSSWYFLPLYFQSSRSLSPLQSGLLLMPMTVIQAVTGFIAGFIIRRTAFLLFTLLSDKSTISAIIGLELLGGLGVGLVFQPPLIALQSFVHHDDVATATAFFGFIRSFSTSVSIVIGGVMLKNEMQSRQGMLQKLLPGDVANSFLGQNATANVALVRSLNPGEAQIVGEAYSQSLSRMWILYACFAATGLLMSFGIQDQTLRSELITETSGSTGTQSRARGNKTGV
ncbi:MFS general substrate transporter [Aspergillus novofumigatus IBT 16806]|uniref:MFS general substrate transporter n=1 Tax=Aspergillus novofumigatus (strain IBT 16806) TaxID=1392255 RepID=A0A2I1CJM3_ASPN1|nr:MFS general substrate transporter [Aspergillus novofumigatus IBT 16806]PKX97814.1 MFS general substrate transporter [Aspergillus novofumigatus IBT 16806]